MSYPLHTNIIMAYIEAHIKDETLDFVVLEKRIGFSYAYIREFFKKNTGASIGEYIRKRKIYSSAFELLHTDKRVVDIALSYGFANHESYTRAFSKIMKMTPSEFRKARLIMGKAELTEGIYGIGLLTQKERRSDVKMKVKEKYQNENGTILYGVPKVEWGSFGGCTPYPMCLKACADYLGDDLEYAEVLVTCGGAFRFTWNEKEWDMCNVDIYHTFTEGAEETIYSYAARALGREFSILGRTKDTTKEEFIAFIKKHIDEGYPCIAQGIIGPPEACIITGYRDDGNTLLGWNFFQNDEGFGGSVSLDECGYFICENWWENEDTQSVMCLGPVEKEAYNEKQIIETAIRVMSPRRDGDYCKGIAGFEVWAKMLLENSTFSEENEALLFEKMLCQDDAVGCLTDGRGCASGYFKKLSEKEIVPEVADKYKAISELFAKEKELAKQIGELLSDKNGKRQRQEMLAKKSVREQAVTYIRQIEVLEKKSLELLTDLK